MAIYLPERVESNGDEFKVLITHDEIQKRVEELGNKISEDYRGKHPILIGVLNGAFIFLSDLLRHVDIPCEVDFYKLSSYGDAKVSSGQVTQRKGLDADIKGRHVILVEDIVDTGLSANYILNTVKSAEPESVALASLLRKPDSIKHPVHVDYVGFDIGPLFVLGYGLDYAQEGRNLAQIYVLDQD